MSEKEEYPEEELNFRYRDKCLSDIEFKNWS